MEIKLKFSEVFRINTVLKTIIEDNKAKINALLKFRLLEIMRSMEPHISNFEIIKNEKIVEYGKETEDGIFQISKDNTEGMEQFEKDIKQVLDSEVLINIDMFQPDAVCYKGVSS